MCLNIHGMMDKADAYEMTPDEAMKLSAKAGATFRPRSPIAHREFFAGRWNQLTSVSDAVFQSGLHIVIFGERGVGKTSLANVVEPLVALMEKDLSGGAEPTPRIVVKVNVSASDSFGEIWRRAFDEITWQEDGPAVGFRPEPDQETRTLREALDMPESPTIDCVRRTLSTLERSIFIFDEFDRASAEQRREFTDLIKALSDYALDSTVILVGVSDTIDSLVRDHGSIARALVEVFLPRMSGKELREILDNASKRLGIRITEEAATMIIRTSQGLPHYTHLIGLNATREAAKRRSREVNASDVGRSFKRAVTDALQTIREKYHTACHSAHKGALYDKVLLACSAAAATSTDDLGYFHASDVVEPLAMILERDAVTIATFQKHINEFTEQRRGEVLERSGVKRSYKYRFMNPMLPPFVFMTAVSSNLADEAKITALITR